MTGLFVPYINDLLGSTNRYIALQLRSILDPAIESGGSGDGLPRYSYVGMYGGAEATSFRGSFLRACEPLLGRELLERTLTHMMRAADAVK